MGRLVPDYLSWPRGKDVFILTQNLQKYEIWQINDNVRRRHFLLDKEVFIFMQNLEKYEIWQITHNLRRRHCLLNCRQVIWIIMSTYPTTQLAMSDHLTIWMEGIKNLSLAKQNVSSSRIPSYQASKLEYLYYPLFITPVYMFRASHCSSIGDWIVLIHHLVWLVCVSDCLVCRSGPSRQT
jgi:hypothetical protein